MRINATLDIQQLVQTTLRGQRHLAHSVVQGINATAKQVQAAERQKLRSIFTLRSSQTQQFLERQVAVIKPFASVRNGILYAEVSVGRRQRLLLSAYETGEQRVPFKGRLIAQPVSGSPARQSFSAKIDDKYTFKALKLKAQGRNKTRRGANHTFTIPGVGVFVRTGPGQRDIKLLYAYKRNQKLKAKLGFIQTARNISGAWLNENIRRAFLRSLTP